MLKKLLVHVNFFKKKTKSLLINIGSSTEMSIKEYADLIKNKIDSSIKIKSNDKRLDKQRKKLNISLASVEMVRNLR